MEPLANERALVDAWLASRDKRARDALAVAYQPLVSEVARQLHRRLPDGHKSSVTVGDLESHGQLGLLAAIDVFDPDRGGSFHQYAAQRIRWSMHVGQREFGVSRSNLEQAKLLATVSALESQAQGRWVSTRELAEQTGATIDPVVESFEDHPGFEGSTSDPYGPDTTLPVSLLRDRVADAISKISGAEGVVLTLFYAEGMHLTEIAAELGTSAGWVSELRNRGLATLRDILTGE